MNYASDAKVNKSSLKPISDISIPISKTPSTMNVVSKRTESNMNLVINSLSKTTLDTRLRGANMIAENEKFIHQKKNSTSKLNMNEKNLKRENFTTLKTTMNREIKGALKYGKEIGNHQNRLEKSVNKINAKLQESKREPVVPKQLSLSKNAIENVKSSSSIAQKSHNKTRSKTKNKSKKLTTTKSEIFTTNNELPDNSFMIRDGDLDLADLIEASLKNIRSPRSIFDYDFSSIEQSDARKNSLKSKNEIHDIDRLKQLKPMRSSVISNYLSNRMNRGNEILEKLSEKSEPFSGTSCESLNDKRALPAGDNGTLSLSEKYIKARAELQKTLDWKPETIHSDPVSFEDRWNSAASFRNKVQSPRKIENSNDKLPIARGPVRSSFLMKKYGTKNLESRRDVIAKNTETVAKNRTEPMKVIKEVERNRLMK